MIRHVLGGIILERNIVFEGHAVIYQHVTIATLRR